MIDRAWRRLFEISDRNRVSAAVVETLVGAWMLAKIGLLVCTGFLGAFYLYNGIGWWRAACVPLLAVSLWRLPAQFGA